MNTGREKTTVYAFPDGEVISDPTLYDRLDNKYRLSVKIEGAVKALIVTLSMIAVPCMPQLFTNHGHNSRPDSHYRSDYNREN